MISTYRKKFCCNFHMKMPWFSPLAVVLTFIHCATMLDSSWNVMAHGDARDGKWSGNWQMKWVASTLHTTSEHGVSSITTADSHTLGASSWLNWHPRRFKWTFPFCRKTKSGFCTCAITFQTQSTNCCPWETLRHCSCTECVVCRCRSSGQRTWN